MRQLTTAFALALIFSLAPATARAQLSETRSHLVNTSIDPPLASQPDPTLPNISTLLELETLLSSNRERNYYNIELSCRMRLEFLRRLTVDFSLGLTRTDMQLFTPGDAAFDVSLEVPWRATIGGRARMILFRWSFLDISFFAEVLFPITQHPAYVRSLAFYDSLELLNLVGIDNLRQMVSVEHVWYRAEFGFTIRGLIGRFRPFLDLKYVHFPGRIDLHLAGDLAGLLSAVNAMPNTSSDASFRSIYYALGLEVLLGYGFALEIRLAASPTLEGGWAFTGRLTLEIPLTSQQARDWGPIPLIRHHRRS